MRPLTHVSRDRMTYWKARMTDPSIMGEVIGRLTD